MCERHCAVRAPLCVVLRLGSRPPRTWVGWLLGMRVGRVGRFVQELAPALAAQKFGSPGQLRWRRMRLPTLSVGAARAELTGRVSSRPPLMRGPALHAPALRRSALPVAMGRGPASVGFAMCRLGGAARPPSLCRAAVLAASLPGAWSRRAARPRSPADFARRASRPVRGHARGWSPSASERCPQPGAPRSPQVATASASECRSLRRSAICMTSGASDV